MGSGSRRSSGRPDVPSSVRPSLDLAASIWIAIDRCADDDQVCVEGRTRSRCRGRTDSTGPNLIDLVVAVGVRSADRGRAGAEAPGGAATVPRLGDLEEAGPSDRAAPDRWSAVVERGCRRGSTVWSTNDVEERRDRGSAPIAPVDGERELRPDRTVTRLMDPPSNRTAPDRRRVEVGERSEQLPEGTDSTRGTSVCSNDV